MRFDPQRQRIANMCEERQQGRRGEVAECHHDYNHPGTPPPHYHSHQHQDGIYVISAGTSCFKLPRAGLNRPQRRTQVRGVPSFVLIGIRESSSESLSSFLRQTLSLSLSLSVSLCLSVCLSPSPSLSLSSLFFTVFPSIFASSPPPPPQSFSSTSLSLSFPFSISFPPSLSHPLRLSVSLSHDTLVRHQGQICTAKCLFALNYFSLPNKVSSSSSSLSWSLSSSSQPPVVTRILIWNDVKPVENKHTFKTTTRFCSRSLTGSQLLSLVINEHAVLPILKALFGVHQPWASAAVL